MALIFYLMFEIFYNQIQYNLILFHADEKDLLSAFLNLIDHLTFFFVDRFVICKIYSVVVLMYHYYIALTNVKMSLNILFHYVNINSLY